ncbi:hypothetical protein [Psychroflexus halocasei]|uniref:Lysylphosphatidylglycerol synthase TM region n=1 Tax=Psychroflexus halocasei TaxID=908615 RepID=A0A1H4D265_9FLAO|nr:hypothetical protein [Psychroflexus halocasei]SEA66678.1 Lysylphosphatidylglycerol synthase TM region [Psychroflexus halocasei]
MTNKTKQIFIKGLQLIVAIICLLYISYEISEEKQYVNTLVAYQENINLIDKLLPLSAVLFISVLNWSIEFLKWKISVSHFRKINFSKAAYHSFASHSIAIFTPQRIGEYAAKFIFFHKRNRKKVLLANFRTSYSQLMSTLVFGLIALFYFVKYYGLELNNTIMYSVLILVILSATILFFTKENFQNKIKSLLIKRPKQLMLLITLSLIKHLVFSHQYFFLLNFIIEVDYLETMMAINLMYLFASFLPSFFIVDFAIKGSVAIFIFNYLGVSATAVGLVSFVMWFLNFALPAIIGTVLLSQHTLKKTALS